MRYADVSKQTIRSDRHAEARLVARMLGGDEEALRDFFNIYHPRLTSFIATRAKSPSLTLNSFTNKPFNRAATVTPGLDQNR